MKNSNNNTKENKKAIFMMGAPGSGKGYTCSRLYSDVKIYDCDSVKAEHADYDPKNPSALHAWSSVECLKRINAHIATSAESFVYDGTGANSTRLISFIEASKKAGFQTEICYVQVALKTSLERNAKRERVVPTEIVIDKYEQVQKSWDIVCSHADNLVVIKND